LVKRVRVGASWVRALAGRSVSADSAASRVFLSMVLSSIEECLVW
jgi:hypothetical protein